MICVTAMLPPRWRRSCTRRAALCSNTCDSRNVGLCRRSGASGGVTFWWPANTTLRFSMIFNVMKQMTSLGVGTGAAFAPRFIATSSLCECGALHQTSPRGHDSSQGTEDCFGQRIHYGPEELRSDDDRSSATIVDMRAGTGRRIRLHGRRHSRLGRNRVGPSSGRVHASACKGSVPVGQAQHDARQCHCWAGSARGRSAARSADYGKPARSGPCHGVPRPPLFHRVDPISRSQVARLSRTCLPSEQQ